MKKLIDGAELRSKRGSAAYEWVKDNMQARDHVKEYADFFKKVLTSKK